jgi:hypothetical protein
MRPGNVTAEAGRLRFGPPGCGRTWLPGASAPCLGFTLSDVSEQGKRAHSRRYGRLSSAGYLRSWALITRRSVQLLSTACYGGRTGLPAGGCATAGTSTRIEQAPLRPHRVNAEVHGVPPPG